ncbi:hypothetical protein RHMOL_Rhmol04G0210300 [Rhododendron molle]|uniref:Uncharacterized protein n=1 Tax=Rhododendron molle TaxID=49168 RepID=A0ACC0P573_RHOML|nr:hypothetical protein RHMOL_Rhmol04G0210300 [Rhododendron molle]
MDLEPTQTRPTPVQHLILVRDVLEAQQAVPKLSKLSQLSSHSQIKPQTLDLAPKINKTKPKHSPMANHGDNGGDGDVVDRLEDRTEGSSAVVTESGGGDRDQQ